MAAEGICVSAGADILWTKLSATTPHGGVERSGGVTFAASQMGGFIFPRFLPAFDAVATLVHLLDMLTATGEPSVEADRRTSSDPHRPPGGRDALGPEGHGHAHRSSSGPQRQDRRPGRRSEAPEPDGWVLVVPDPEEPLTHVWAEAPSDSEARARCREHAVRIRQMMR